MTQTSTIKVMVVDDSVVVRGLLRRIIEKEPKLEIISTASDGEIALSDYKNLGPDIVLLDIEMPVMDGITALKHMLSYDPDARIIICSSLGSIYEGNPYISIYKGNPYIIKHGKHL